MPRNKHDIHTIGRAHAILDEAGVGDPHTDSLVDRLKILLAQRDEFKQIINDVYDRLMRAEDTRYSWFCGGCGDRITTYPPEAFDEPPPNHTQMFCMDCV